jgi:Flp pilus assembly protein TadD
MNLQDTLNLGLDHHEAGNLAQAESIYRGVLAQHPNHPQALHLLGVLASQVGRHDAAVDLLNRAIAGSPMSADYYLNLGVALDGLGRSDDAIVAYRRSLALNPELIEAMNNLGSAYFDKGDLDQALSFYQSAVARRPDFATAQRNMGHIFLMRGDFERGWPLHEWRWRIKNFVTPRFEFSQPLWTGGDLNGKRILLHAEQGIGDAIQFMRYAPLVARRGAKVIFYCPPELVRIAARVDGIEQSVGWDKPPPAFDVHCPLLSLPGIFKTTLADIPATVPYLTPDPTAVEKWTSRVTTAASGRRKIGLTWAGRQQPDPLRSVPPQLLAPLATAGGNWFCSLQKGNETKAPPELELTHWTAELADFADTAALLANLDLVITIDTAIAHLAGAMGKPTWLLLKSAPDWRWMLQRADSPWYPTLRLFRQPRSGDWQTPIGQLVQALKNS